MKKFFKIISLFLLLNVTAMSVQGGTYYIDDNGEASWEDCEHAAGTPGPKSGASACNLATANSNVAPGDTVFLREGTYYPEGRYDCIHPGQSGSSENRIVYENYNGETVILDGDSSDAPEAILFCAGWDTGDPNDGRNYITVRGINFVNWNQLGEMRYASYNEVAECVFFGHRNLSCDYNGFYLSQESKHNWIHGNTWHSFGHFVDRDASCILNVGHDNVGNAENSGNDYNTVEDNHFYASGHHVVGINNAKFNIIRNNYFHNEGWSTEGACTLWATGKCGYRVMSMSDASGLDVAGSNLLEDNNIAYGAQYGGPHLVGGGSGSGLTVDTDKNIVRYNNFFGNVLVGMRIGSSIGECTGNDNRVYNNTFYYNGYNMDSWGIVNEDDTLLHQWGDYLRGGFTLYGNVCDGTLDSNVIKNNLAHDIWAETNNLSSSSLYYPAFFVGLGDGGGCNEITNNWGNEGGRQSGPFTPYPDPMFIDPDISDPMALIFIDGEWTGKPDLSLRESSPVIDSATYLTQANGTDTNSTTLVVDDAKYFQDGTWGSDLARMTLHADCIAIGTVSNTVQINSIDYSTNSITLVSTMTWDDNTPVWLYKKSDGDIVLSGDAPDYGAHEYGTGSSIPPTPINLQPNFPNPFNRTTTINYSVSQGGNIKLIIYDLLGREIKVLVNEYQAAGSQSADWDGTNHEGTKVSSGTYFYQIRIDDGEASSKKMIFLR